MITEERLRQIIREELERAHQPVGFYGTRRDMPPPPGLSRRSYRSGCQSGKLPGKKLPGRGGWVVSVAEWDAWSAGRRLPDNATVREELEAQGFSFPNRPPPDDPLRRDLIRLSATHPHRFRAPEDMTAEERVYARECRERSAMLALRKAKAMATRARNKALKR